MQISSNTKALFPSLPRARQQRHEIIAPAFTVYVPGIGTVASSDDAQEIDAHDLDK